MEDKEIQIREIVKRLIGEFVTNFEDRHNEQIHDVDGILNRKIRNRFISSLGEDIQFHAAMSRSFDSSLGYLIENIAREIAKISFDVKRMIKGPISSKQISTISEIINDYRSLSKPSKDHYDRLIDTELEETNVNSYITDFLLKEKDNDVYYIIELKMGGDLDTKKARSEKETMMEQFSILSNIIGNDKEIHCYFATAYNRFGHGNQWKQRQVQQFFSEDELLIEDKFWNFICQDEKGYEIVMSEYAKNSNLITKALNRIRKTYL